MKRLLVVLLCTTVSPLLLAKHNCSWNCKSGCSTATIEYTADCQGNLVTFTAEFVNPDGSVRVMTDANTPGFVGVSVAALGDGE